MPRRRRAISCLIAFVAASLAAGRAAAQPAPPNPDVERLQRQIEDMQRRLDRYESRPAPGTAPNVPPAVANAPGCRRGRDGTSYCPGWVIEVLGAGPSQRPSLVGRFLAPSLSQFQMYEHQRFFPYDNVQVTYEGKGLLNVITPGQYGFVINGEGTSSGMRCSHQLAIDGKMVAASAVRRGSAAGGADLQAGLHEVTFDFACQQRAGRVGSEHSESPSMLLLLLPPGEDMPRPLRPSELVHVAN